MAWTSPSTWGTGQQVTKSQFAAWNSDLTAVGDHTAWSTWAPDGDWTAFKGSDASVKGRKLKVGQVAFAAFDITWGTTANGGVRPQCVFNIFLPWAANVGPGDIALGYAYLYGPTLDDTWLLTPITYTGDRVWLYLTWAGTSTESTYVDWASNKSTPWAETPDTNFVNMRIAGVLAYRTNT